MLEANFLGIFGLTEDRQRQFGGFGQDFHARDPQFDLAGRQVGVHDRGLAGHHLTVHADDALGAQTFDGLEARRLGVQHQLRQAVVVAQVDEQKAAVVALAVDPAGQADIRTGIGQTEGAAGVGAVGVHGRFVLDYRPQTAQFGRAEGRIIAPESQGLRPDRGQKTRPVRKS